MSSGFGIEVEIEAKVYKSSLVILPYEDENQITAFPIQAIQHSARPL